MLAVLLLIPGAVWACPFCSTGRQGQLTAYIGPTLLLIVLPLLLIGGLVWWIRREMES